MIWKEKIGEKICLNKIEKRDKEYCRKGLRFNGNGFLEWKS